MQGKVRGVHDSRPLGAGMDSSGSEDRNVIVSRTGETRGTLHCIPSSPPSFELESYDAGTAWSPDGQWVAADGVAVCRTDGSTGYWLSPGLEADWQRRIQR